MNKAKRVGAAQKSDWALIGGLFVSSRLLVLLVAVVGPLLLNPDARFHGRITDVGWKAYVNLWDVGWYGDVALNGYRYGEGLNNCNIVFFPLFPMILRGLHALGLDVATAGLLCSNLFFGVALWLFFRLVLLETGRRETAERAAALLAFSPAGIWFFLGLTESLFLLLTLALVVAALGRRWRTMMILGVLAGLTRPNGFVLAIPLLVLLWPELKAAWSSQAWRKLAGFLVVPLGPVVGAAGFFTYLRIVYKGWDVFFKVNSAQWHNGTSLSLETLAQRIPGLGLRLFDSPTIYETHIAWSWTLVIAAGLVSAVALWEHRARPWHLAFLATFFAFHAFLYQGVTPIGPIARYAAVVPAFYVGLVLFSEQRRWAQSFFLAAFAGALVLQTAMVVAGYHLN